MHAETCFGPDNLHSCTPIHASEWCLSIIKPSLERQHYLVNNQKLITVFVSHRIAYALIIVRPCTYWSPPRLWGVNKITTTGITTARRFTVFEMLIIFKCLTAEQVGLLHQCTNRVWSHQQMVESRYLFSRPSWPKLSPPSSTRKRTAIICDNVILTSFLPYPNKSEVVVSKIVS